MPLQSYFMRANKWSMERPSQITVRYAPDLIYFIVSGSGGTLDLKCKGGMPGMPGMPGLPPGMQMPPGMPDINSLMNNPQIQQMLNAPGMQDMMK